MDINEPTVKVTLTVKNGIKKEYLVGLPNVDQHFAINTFKLLLSKDKYDIMVRSKDSKYLENVYLIDALSTFAILIPGLEKDYGLDHLGDVKMKQWKEILQQYKDVYEPFYEKSEEDLEVV